MESLGYFINYSVVNIADFGLPQARRRLVLVASTESAISLPPTSGHIGW
ncbi:MAG: DNA cytosine methyltransferase [Nostoc sp.]